jgi:hypothetical protein
MDTALDRSSTTGSMSQVPTSCVKGYKMESILGKPGKTTCKIDGMHEL